MRSPFLHSHGFGSLEEHKAHLTPVKGCILSFLLSITQWRICLLPLLIDVFFSFFVLRLAVRFKLHSLCRRCPCWVSNNASGCSTSQSSRVTERSSFLPSLGAMQTPEAGADSTSTVPLQTSVPVQPPGSTQQVPVQPQVPAAPVAASSCRVMGPCVNLRLFPVSRRRLFNRFSMFTQHRCSMWRKTAASTPMATCESICSPALHLTPLHKY